MKHKMVSRENIFCLPRILCMMKIYIAYSTA